jgi:hypothetical protein
LYTGLGDLRERQPRDGKHIDWLGDGLTRHAYLVDRAQPGRVDDIRAPACSKAWIRLIVSAKSGLPRIRFSARAVSMKGKSS